uniref:Uncharacterized protein n=1 Tax=Anguilla anguilla TaxID=7936 RepID=A0A0E9S9H6_ANGAN
MYEKQCRFYPLQQDRENTTSDPFYTDKSVIGNGDDPWQCFFPPQFCYSASTTVLHSLQLMWGRHVRIHINTKSGALFHPEYAVQKKHGTRWRDVSFSIAIT